MWNLKGRILAEGGPLWRTWFEYDATAGEDYCLAPDYPLVWSAVVARLWIACGAATPLAPLGASLAVLAAIVAATVGLVAERWGAASGLLAGLVILGTDLVLKLATSQAADLPLALWIVATLGCLGAAERDPTRAGSWLLAGVLGGLAAGAATGLVAGGLYFAVVFAVFVLTPFPLAGHLEATLRRLFVQGWPAAVVTWFWLTGPLGTPSGPRLPGPDESARLR